MRLRRTQPNRTILLPDALLQTCCANTLQCREDRRYGFHVSWSLSLEAEWQARTLDDPLNRFGQSCSADQTSEDKRNRIQVQHQLLLQRAQRVLLQKSRRV